MAQHHVVGVISDTHIPHRLNELPTQVYEYLAGCDVILHAGDLEDVRILEKLRRIAPVQAVRGNIHWQASMGEHDQDLPLFVTVPWGNHLIYMTHGHLSFFRALVDKVAHISKQPKLSEINQIIIARLARVKPHDADVVIFGHTHLPCAEWLEGVLYYNPGAVCPTTKPTVSASLGKLVLSGDGSIQPEWLHLV